MVLFMLFLIQNSKFIIQNFTLFLTLFPNNK